MISNDLKKEKDSELLQYGLSQGYLSFRQNLSNFIGEREQRVVNPETLFITNGATHGILLSIIATSDGNASIIVERPTYFPLLDLFKELGLKIYFADVDEYGISTNGIKKCLKKIKSGRVFIHCTPHFQNPTGVCMNEKRADELLDIVNNNENVWLLADNVYKYLDFYTKISKNLFTESRCKKIIQIGSLSKIFGPGLRVGWLETTEENIKTIEESGYVQSSGGFNPFVCRSIEIIIKSGYINKIIEIWASFLRRKQQKLITDLRKIFPEAKFTVPSGGYYIWADLKNSLLSNSSFREFVKNNKNVIYVPGTKCAGSPNLYQTYTRLGFATYNGGQLSQGLKRLRTAFTDFNIKK